MVEVLDDGGNAMANAMQSSDIVKDIKRVLLNLLWGFWNSYNMSFQTGLILYQLKILYTILRNIVILFTNLLSKI